MLNPASDDDRVSTLQQVELGVLGPLQVRQYGLPVAVPGAKPRAVLTLLGLHGGSVVPAEVLVELLWGDDPPRTAAKALQTHISALRRALGDGFVLTEGAGWRLGTAEIDAVRYRAVARQARDAFEGGDAGQAVARFDEALALWRGTPELPDAPRGIAEKTRWKEGHAALVEDRADALLATGRAAEIIGELEAAVADAPLRERRWGHLMLALYRAGRQGEALGAYQRARSLLAEELGVDPGPELRRLEAAIVAQDAALEVSAPQRISAVTRAVTFLLTDIEGSTAAWEADAAAMGVALARHDEIVEQIVTSRGGRLVKTRGEGDATFSVFDRPSAAAAASIDLQEAIRHESWALREPIRVRVALHTGEVELRDGDYFGRAVNRAARLRSLATGGQILCSGATAELVIDTLPDDVVLADLGMRQLRNLARPEHVFELRLDGTATSDAPEPEQVSRPALPAVLGGPGPFVGRGDELARLLAVWQTTLTAGTSAVLIAGEPGVGKTRLAGEWSRRAYEQGAVVLYGRCDEDLGAPYQPFAEALRTLVPCLGPNRLRGLRGVEALLPLVPGLIEALPDLPSPPRADPDTERYALFDAVVALLSTASKSAPVVLVLDDLHWAAKPTLLLLRHLLRFGEQSRVQIVGTYRSTDLDRSHPLAAMLADLHRDGTAVRLALSGLDERDVTAYVAGAGYDDEELARALAAVTGGNPFFLIEALRHVEESDGRWDPHTLPQGVREAVSRRLSRLPVETNKALAAAAVVGSRFEVALVERVVGEDLVDAFDEAAKAGIVIEEPGGWYRFNHALVRQSLLAELASVRRMRLHHHIAVTLEEDGADDEELLAELAYHYFECAWSGNAVKAVHYCRRAGDQAMDRLAFEGAADHYDHALHALAEVDDELADRDDQQAELMVARCEALLAAGDVTSAAGAVAQLLREAGGSERLAAWGACFEGELTMLTEPERLDEIERAVAAAATTLADLGDAAGEAKAHTVRAGCLARLGRIGDCETALDQALTAARRTQEHRLVNAVLANAPLAALWGPNPVPRAGGRCLDVVRLLRITTGSPVVEATSTRCQGVLDAYRGRAGAGRQLIESARRSLTDLGIRHALLEIDQFAGIVEMVADEPASAEPLLRHAYNGFRRMGLDADAAQTAALLARVCLALGRDDEAGELCSESERLAGHALKPAIAWRTVRAELLARRGEFDDAIRVAKQAVAIAERTDALIDHGDACLALATVLDAAGDGQAARAAAERAHGLYERKGAVVLAEKARSVLASRGAATGAGLGAAPHGFASRPERPRLENAASRAEDRAYALYAQRRLDEFGALLIEDHYFEDRRPGFRRVGTARAEALENVRTIASMGAEVTNTPVALRGERLCLSHVRFEQPDTGPEPFWAESLEVSEIDADGMMVARIVFDVADFDAAIAELDARYVAGEAAPMAHAWSVVTGGHAALSRGASDDLLEFGRASRDEAGDRSRYIENVHRLSDLGAVVTTATHGGDFEADWRVVALMTVEGDAFDRVELFDVADIEAALARFDELSAPAPRLENAASRVSDRLHASFTAHDWVAMADALAADMHGRDHRKAMNIAIDGRDAVIESYRAGADMGVIEEAPVVLATRGEHLVLDRLHYCVESEQPHAFRVDLLRIIETDSSEKVVGVHTFDSDDVDAAFAELDALYLAGEAAPHGRAWSVVAAGYASLNRREIPALSPNWVDIDRRRATAFASGEQTDFIRASWQDTPDIRIHIAVVHRLSDEGAVVTSVSRGTTHQGFEAEWTSVELLMVDGDAFSRCELFDVTSLDAALARFDELSRSVRKPENSAYHAFTRYMGHFVDRDWDAMAGMLADDFSTDDRRRVVKAGQRHGRDAELAHMRLLADIGVSGFSTSLIATRGQRLFLGQHRVTSSDSAEPSGELIGVVEIDTDNRISAHIMFEADDIEAAYHELDSRYRAGEAAPYAHTWTVLTRAYHEANNRMLSEFTDDVVSVDHRRTRAFAPGEIHDYLAATWELSPGATVHIEAVHRLSELGAVVTHAVKGTSRHGFEAEWLEVSLMTLRGDLINRLELYHDLDAALARFEELSTPPLPVTNAASRVVDRYLRHYAARDWDAMAHALADDFSSDDRRRVVSSGIRYGREFEVANIKAISDVGCTAISTTPIATRGEQLVLSRQTYDISDWPDNGVQTLDLVQIGDGDLIVAHLAFDPDDMAAAFAELDARYVAGEAAPYARTWRRMTRVYTTLNRHEFPPTTPDWINVDHRRAASFGPGETLTYLAATWKLMPDYRMRALAVHRLSDLGGVVTHGAHGASHGGFDAEWRLVLLLMFDGDLIARCELYDEADLGVALARFDELNRPVAQLGNAASRLHDRINASFASRDWDAIAAMVHPDICSDDRRRVVNSGLRQGRAALIAELSSIAEVGIAELSSQVIATRGERLALSRTQASQNLRTPEAFSADLIDLIEIDADGLGIGRLVFDADDVDAALAELESRYLAGEANAWAHTWSVIAASMDSMNRHRAPLSTPDWVTLDHRRGMPFAPDSLDEIVSATPQVTPDLHSYIESVHRLNAHGAVITQVSHGSTEGGFDAEWRMLSIQLVDGEALCRCELFDEDDLSAALTRFDELSRQPHLENAAVAARRRVAEMLNRRELDALLALGAPDGHVEDRRRVLRHQADGPELSKIVHVLDGMPQSWQLAVKPVATRGSRVSLTRDTYRDTSEPDTPITAEHLTVTSLGGDGLIHVTVLLDPEDLDAAYAELDAQYSAREASDRARVWSVVTGVFDAHNRREIARAAPNAASVDHRRGAGFAPGQGTDYVLAGWEAGQRLDIRIEAVHRINGVGAVFTWTGQGSSRDGFDAEWRGIELMMVEEGVLCRAEVFDESDLDAALARFDELAANR